MGVAPSASSSVVVSGTSRGIWHVAAWLCGCGNGPLARPPPWSGRFPWRQGGLCAGEWGAGVGQAVCPTPASWSGVGRSSTGSWGVGVRLSTVSEVQGCVPTRRGSRDRRGRGRPISDGAWQGGRSRAPFGRRCAMGRSPPPWTTRPVTRLAGSRPAPVQCRLRRWPRSRVPGWGGENPVLRQGFVGSVRSGRAVSRSRPRGGGRRGRRAAGRLAGRPRAGPAAARPGGVVSLVATGRTAGAERRGQGGVSGVALRWTCSGSVRVCGRRRIHPARARGGVAGLRPGRGEARWSRR